MKKKLKKLSIVIPVYNEEEVIPELIKQLRIFINKKKEYYFEVIIIEHGSIDRSYELLKKTAKEDKRFKILRLSRNFGADNAITAGMHYATGDALVIMMADLQEPIELIVDFIKKWEEGYEIVYGIVKKRTAGLMRNFLSILFYKIMSLMTGNLFPENVSDFRLIDKKVYQVINQMKEQNKYLRGLINWTGFRQVGIAFDRKPRFAGKSKATFGNVLYVALNGIFSFSYTPLRLISVLGIIITLISFIMIIIYLFLYFIYGRINPGVTTIIILMLFLFGILFFALGIISEYFARIYEDVKARPTFIVKQKINL